MHRASLKAGLLSGTHGADLILGVYFPEVVIAEGLFRFLHGFGTTVSAVERIFFHEWKHTMNSMPTHMQSLMAVQCFVVQGPRHYSDVTRVLQGLCKGKVTARLKRSGSGINGTGHPPNAAVA